VHELGADGAAVDFAGTIRVRAADSQLGVIKTRKVAERIEVCLQVSPAAEKFKGALSRLGFRADCSGNNFSL